jgi:hypothetical protein
VKPNQSLEPTSNVMTGCFPRLTSHSSGIYEWQIMAEAVSKRTKKSLELEFTPFTCQNKVIY